MARFNIEVTYDDGRVARGFHPCHSVLFYGKYFTDKAGRVIKDKAPGYPVKAVTRLTSRFDQDYTKRYVESIANNPVYGAGISDVQFDDKTRVVSYTLSDIKSLNLKDTTRAMQFLRAIDEFVGLNGFVHLLDKKFSDTEMDPLEKMMVAWKMYHAQNARGAFLNFNHICITQNPGVNQKEFDIMTGGHWHPDQRVDTTLGDYYIYGGGIPQINIMYDGEAVLALAQHRTPHDQVHLFRRAVTDEEKIRSWMEFKERHVKEESVHRPVHVDA